MFGEAVRQHRRRLGLSQEDLAKLTGISVRSIRKIETGETAVPRSATVRLLADAFGLAGAERDRFYRSPSGEDASRPTSAPRDTSAAAAEAQPGGSTTSAPLGGSADATSDPATVSTSRQPGPAGDTPDGATMGEPRPSPAQLPADVAGFTGRQEHLHRLDALLDDGDAGSTAVAIAALVGTAGVGKTALAVHWAHQVRSLFDDGQLYINLRGFDPAGTVVDPAEAIRRFLDALGVPANRIPLELDAQAALYRSMLADRRVLIVLDNARDAAQVRPLLPGTPGCVVLVTSRDRLSGLIAAGARPIPLDVLTAGEARGMLTARLGTERTAGEPEAIEEIVVRCARLPLALAIVTARATIHPGFGLGDLAGELRGFRDRLDALADEDPVADVRSVFSWSYTALTPPAAELFRLLGLHPGPDISVSAAAALANDSSSGTRRTLAELTRANLLVEHAPGRYHFHDLLRAYATDLTLDNDPEAVRRSAQLRLLDHYAHAAHAADRSINPHRNPIPPGLAPSAPQTPAEEFAEREAAMSWLLAEYPVLLASIRLAGGAGHDRHVWQLAWSLDTLLYRRGHRHELAAAWLAAVSAADRIGDVTARTNARSALSHAYVRLGRFDDAETLLRAALELCTRSGDRLAQANTLLDMSMLWEHQGRLDRSLEDAERGLELHRQVGNAIGQAFALNMAGWTCALLGEYPKTLTYCTEALELFRRIGDRYGEAATWDSLGYAHHHLGSYDRAVDCYRHALTLIRGHHDRYHEVSTLIHIGDTCHAAGDRTAARTAWQDALAILTEFDQREADTLRVKLEELERDEHLAALNPAGMSLS